MMRKMACAAVLVLSAVACSGARESMRERLEQSVDYFHAHLVGGEPDRAASYVALDAREAFLERHDPYRGALRLEEVQLVSVRDEPSSGNAIVLIDASVRHPSSITIRRVRYREVWTPTKNGWNLVSEEIVPPPGRSPVGGAAPEPRGRPSFEATIPVEQP